MQSQCFSGTNSLRRRENCCVSEFEINDGKRIVNPMGNNQIHNRMWHGDKMCVFGNYCVIVSPCQLATPVSLWRKSLLFTMQWTIVSLGLPWQQLFAKRFLHVDGRADGDSGERQLVQRIICGLHVHYYGDLGEVIPRRVYEHYSYHSTC